MNMKGQNLLGVAIIFFIVFIVVGIIFTNLFEDARIGFMIGLFAGFIVSGGGKFIWTHNT